MLMDPDFREVPTWQPVELHCSNCGETWDAWQPIGVPVATWIAHIRAGTCPNCGVGNRNVVMRPADEPPP